VIPRALATGADGVEIYTGAYAAAFHTGSHQPILDRIAATSAQAKASGLVVNAGHDLNLHNIPPLMRAVPFLAEASIGHELTADALENGFAATVAAYAAALRQN
jgi:pyridoxine 5-phosphate synthase